MDEPRLLQGNEACARGAIAAGCRFYAGYPITPSSEIAEVMARRLPEVGGVFVQMEDEIASLGAVIGASLAGTKAMTATSGPGFTLMQEHIGFAAMAEIPCVIADVMRLGPSTGFPTAPSQGDVMQTRWGSHGDYPVIVLAPASVREVFELTVRAFTLSERFRVPVIVAFDEIVGHTRETVTLPEHAEIAERVRPTTRPEAYLPYAMNGHGVPPLASFGDGYRFHVTGLAHDERGRPSTDAAVIDGLLRRLQDKTSLRADEILDIERFLLDDADVAIIAYGIVGRAAREAVLRARRRGQRVGLLRPVTLWPFPETAVAELSRQVDRIVVAEMNLGQVIREVAAAAAGGAEVVGHLRTDGEAITPGDLLTALADLAPSTRGSA